MRTPPALPPALHRRAGVALAAVVLAGAACSSNSKDSGGASARKRSTTTTTTTRPSGKPAPANTKAEVSLQLSGAVEGQFRGTGPARCGAYSKGQPPGLDYEVSGNSFGARGMRLVLADPRGDGHPTATLLAGGRTFTGGPESGTLKLAGDLSGASVQVDLQQVGGSALVRLEGTIACKGS